MIKKKVKIQPQERIDMDSGYSHPDVLYMSKGNFDAYMKLMDPTRGMSKKQKKLYKLLYED